MSGGNLAEAELYSLGKLAGGEAPSTGAAERRRREHLAQEAEKAQEEQTKIERLLGRSSVGLSARDVWLKLGGHGDVAHVERRLLELEDDQRAHEIEGRWHAGAGEPRSRSLVAAVTPTRDPQQDSVKNRPAPLTPRSGVRRVETVARREIGGASASGSEGAPGAPAAASVVEESTVPRERASSGGPGAAAGRELPAELQGGEASPELARRTDPAPSCQVGAEPAAEDLEPESSLGIEVPTGRGLETAAAPSASMRGAFDEGALYPSQSAPWAPQEEPRGAQQEGEGPELGDPARAAERDLLPTGDGDGQPGDRGDQAPAPAEHAEPSAAPQSGPALEEASGAGVVDLRLGVLQVLERSSTGMRMFEIAREVFGTKVSPGSHSYHLVQSCVMRLVAGGEITITGRGTQSLYRCGAPPRCTLQQWCKVRRNQLGIPQRELGRRAGVPTSAVAALEAGSRISSKHVPALERELGKYDPDEVLTLPADPSAREPLAEGGGRLAAGSSSSPPETSPANAGSPEALELQALLPGGPGDPSARTGAGPAARGSGGGPGEGLSPAGDLALQRGGASLRAALQTARAALELAMQVLDRTELELEETRGRCAAAEGECERLRGRLEAARQALGDGRG